ncbi:MAG TPA: arsenate reductase ArsC [Flavobacteriales bacterium]|nr:arsenate reductase ArsC [Flavobacteriales bacterium]
MNILVLCTGNSCRSQMAEGFLRKFMNNNDTIYSAGVSPEPVNQYAIQVMEEVGIDISGHTSNHVNEFTDSELDVVLTVCDNAYEVCPAFPGSVRKLHHNFIDPSNVEPEDACILNVYRKTRDTIEAYCVELASEISS